MRLFRLITPLVMLIAALTGPARADGHGGDIQTVIENQLSAFQANDLDTAFSFAAPTIQQIFKNPQNFGRMVQQGYPMVWRPARHEMLKLVETSSGPVQVVLFEDAAGRLHEAGYLMVQIDGRWRIAGVHLREQPGIGT
ncbi:MAG: DUF4864 domain-containing protein [Pseudomonadota bacterium]